ncbi:hypothetical protein F4804DRAFT_69707 [Jackrogersella minutella]|nr:hypothetical protein F4804DRAFT_69707 [Jackrogersella minutella]
MEKSLRPKSPLWHRALERYQEELGGDEDNQAINEVHSLDDLLSHVKSIQAMPSRDRQTWMSLNRLAPKFKFVDDFSATIALAFGADATLTAVVWGSIRLILTLASPAGDILQDVLEMLEELSLNLPRFRLYEDTPSMSRQLETALIDVCTEVICFYARTIHLFRAHPHALLRRKAWESHHNDLSRTTMRIKRISSVVDSEADLARMSLDDHKYKEVIKLMDNLTTGRNDDDKQTKYRHIPFLQNSRFSGRSELLSKIHGALDPGQTPSSTKSIALFGMGGVGKTQLALQYAYQAVETFGVVLWVAADNLITISQSFRAIAQGLQLYQNTDEIQDSAAAIWKVKNWLSNTSMS